MRHRNHTTGALEDLVDQKSGLPAISGESSDMRLLHAAATLIADAHLAINMICMSVRKEIAAMMAVLGGPPRVHGRDLRK
jgi:acetate kinase